MNCKRRHLELQVYDIVLTVCCDSVYGKIGKISDYRLSFEEINMEIVLL